MFLPLDWLPFKQLAKFEKTIIIYNHQIQKEKREEREKKKKEKKKKEKNI